MPWRFVKCVDCDDVRPSVSKRPNCTVGNPRCHKRMYDVNQATCFYCATVTDLSALEPLDGLPLCSNIECGKSLGHPKRVVIHPSLRTIRRRDTP